ncbi:hypothetical protein ACWERV_16140 [Streptomyces sp. NPDC004031]
MSTTLGAGVPACLLNVLHRCHGCASGRPRTDGGFLHNDLSAEFAVSGASAGCLRCVAVLALPERAGLPGGRRRARGDRVRGGRPAWQSPYGPAPHRAPRDRWARAAAPTPTRSVPRRGHVCGRCD